MMYHYHHHDPKWSNTSLLLFQTKSHKNKNNNNKTQNNNNNNNRTLLSLFPISRERFRWWWWLSFVLFLLLCWWPCCPSWFHYHPNHSVNNNNINNNINNKNNINNRRMDDAFVIVIPSILSCLFSSSLIMTHSTIGCHRQDIYPTMQIIWFTLAVSSTTVSSSSSSSSTSSSSSPLLSFTGQQRRRRRQQQQREQQQQQQESLVQGTITTFAFDQSHQENNNDQEVDDQDVDDDEPIEDDKGKNNRNNNILYNDNNDSSSTENKNNNCGTGTPSHNLKEEEDFVNRDGSLMEETNNIDDDDDDDDDDDNNYDPQKEEEALLQQQQHQVRRRRVRRTLVLAVDGGTESLRVACFDATTGELIKNPNNGLPVTSVVPYPTSYPHPGWAEQDPLDWYHCLCEAVQQTMIQLIKQTNTKQQQQQQPQPNNGNNENDEEEEEKSDQDDDVDDDWEVAAICMDTTCCSVVALDQEYQPLRPCLLWMDQRSAPQTHQIATLGQGDPALLINGAGGTNGRGGTSSSGDDDDDAMITPGRTTTTSDDDFVPMISAEWMTPKALWLYQNEYQDTWQKAAVICEYQDYMNYRLTNRLVASSCNAAVRWHWDARYAVTSSLSSSLSSDTVQGATTSTKDEISLEQEEQQVYPGRPLSLYQKLGIPDLAQKLPKSCLSMGQVVGRMTRQAAQDLGLLLDEEEEEEDTSSSPRRRRRRLPLVIQGGPDAFVGMIGLGCIGDKSTTQSSANDNKKDMEEEEDQGSDDENNNKPQLCLITGSSHLHCLVVPAAPTTTTTTTPDPPTVAISPTNHDDHDDIVSKNHIQKEGNNNNSGGGGGGIGMWGPYQDAPLPGIAFGEGGQSSTGSLLKWAHTKLFGNNNNNDITTLTYKELDDWASQIPPGSDGLLALETFQGSRTPVTDALARGALIGLTLSHTKGHIWRALMEGVCFGTRACLDALEVGGGQGKCHEIVLAGGIANSPLWLQLHADITNRPIRVFGPQHNAPLLGCAILASVGLGIYDSFETAVQAMLPPSTVIQPNPETSAIYNRIYQGVYAQLAPTIRPLVHAIHQHVLTTPQQQSEEGEEHHLLEACTETTVPSDTGRQIVTSSSSTSLLSSTITISPSLLACDFGSIEAEVNRCLDAGATRFHVDVFDGVALNSPEAFSFGPAMVRSIAKVLQKYNNNRTVAKEQQDHPWKLPSMDLHLCVHRPERFIEVMAEAVEGSPCRFIFQWEGLPKWGRLNKALFLARTVREHKMECGISINPNTPVEEIYPLLQSGLISVVDVLAVDPGFGGQDFQSHILTKVSTLQKWKEQQQPTIPPQNDVRNGWGLKSARLSSTSSSSSSSLSELDILVDGGVNSETAAHIIEAGATVLVSGSFIFGHVQGIQGALLELAGAQPLESISSNNNNKSISVVL